ncbi:MAG: ATP-dependent DNA helicase RecG [Alphaproteobacteria bacterium]|nr:ATP-dependent DNA helicase RecG [Alphaproteobacteria bacterium]
MRPALLFDLFAPITTLGGVGPRVAALIEKVAGARVVDLLWHLPTGLIDRSYSPKIAEARVGSIATMTVRVLDHRPSRAARQPYRVRCADETGELILIFFHARPDYLSKALPPGEVRIVSGTIEAYGGQLQMTHPDHIGTVDDLASLAGVEPVYGLTAGLSLKVMGRAVHNALAVAPELAEWIDPAWRRQQAWAGWRESVIQAHSPEHENDLLPQSPARARLAYDELLASQLALLLVRAQVRRQRGRSTAGDGRMRSDVESILPFTLTVSQRQAVADIVADLASDNRMLRLLQGDVGSGKTVVALMAMLNAVEVGRQAALMAPTEILASQHFATIKPLADSLGVDVVLLTGRDRGKARTSIVERIKDGDIPLVVGTHALFQDDIAFKDLALAVVDEQHRFGVHQRMMLAGKGRGVDILVMTATPIPRTLLLAAYGDMDVSRLSEKPAGRRPVTTRTVSLSRLEDVVAAVGRALDGGDKVYWVCPLVEDSEVVDLAAATERYDHLVSLFGDRVGLVHGRMKGKEKDRVMAAFAAGSTDILVATTVIEVGVDVPAATIMVVEHAERFGLAQLHQLRGRVGRGEQASACLLLYASGMSDTARKRLKIMRETDDGFRIAEEDLKLRGAGEVLGTRQSGLPDFHLADLSVHGELLAAARDDAKLALERDPQLKSDRGTALRTLLYLFERDVAVTYLRSG